MSRNSLSKRREKSALGLRNSIYKGYVIMEHGEYID
jgi:hypothetical protein